MVDMNIFQSMIEGIGRMGNRGVAAIEYALIASLIALTFLVGLANLGGAVSNQFNSVDSNVGQGTQFGTN
jgi:Flp pilus assembly pilin Flp